MSVEPSRRQLLALAGLGVLGGLTAGCTNRVAPPPAPPTADELVRARAANQELQLAEQARRTGRRHPGLAAVTAAAVAHEGHATALAETLAAPRVATRSPTPTGTTGGALVPGTARAAIKALARAQQAAAVEHRQALADSAVSGALARLLASVAGSDDALALDVTAAGS